MNIEYKNEKGLLSFSNLRNIDIKFIKGKGVFNSFDKDFIYIQGDFYIDSVEFGFKISAEKNEVFTFMIKKRGKSLYFVNLEEIFLFYDGHLGKNLSLFFKNGKVFEIPFLEDEGENIYVVSEDYEQEKEEK